MGPRSTDRRGQTPADYLVGISLLLVTIIGVFAFVPTIFQPFEQPANPDDSAMADEVADDLVRNHTMLGEERTLDLDELNETFGSGLQASDLGGVPEWKQVNVTLWSGDRRVTDANGDDPWQGDTAGGTTIRTVTSYQGACADGCRLVVRVWTR